eukprot:159307_1
MVDKYGAVDVERKPYSNRMRNHKGQVIKWISAVPFIKKCIGIRNTSAVGIDPIKLLTVNMSEQEIMYLVYELNIKTEEDFRAQWNKGKVYDLYFTERAKTNGETCVVCMDKYIDSVMVKCHHMCLCEDCASEWRMPCPICRSTVDRIVKENQLDKNKIKIFPMSVSVDEMKEDL